MTALRNPSCSSGKGKGVAEKAPKPPVASGDECGSHPEHVELEGSLSGWMAAGASPYQGGEEGKAEIYPSHARDAAARPGLSQGSELAPGPGWGKSLLVQITGTCPVPSPLSGHGVKRAEISHRGFTRDKANFHSHTSGADGPAATPGCRGTLGTGLCVKRAFCEPGLVPSLLTWLDLCCF